MKSMTWKGIAAVSMNSKICIAVSIMIDIVLMTDHF